MHAECGEVRRGDEMSPGPLFQSAEGDCKGHRSDVGGCGSKQVAALAVAFVIRIGPRGNSSATSSPGFETTGRSRSTMRFISLNEHVAMQIPKLSESSTTAVKPGEARSIRKP